MMPRVRTFGRLLAAALLTLCLGPQILEATGQWDRTLQDAGDEAIIVTVVLCIGSAVAVARAARHRISLSRVLHHVVLVLAAAVCPFNRRPACPTLSVSPPVGLRV